MILYGEIFDLKAKPPDIKSKFRLHIERLCVKPKLSYWSDFHFHFYFLFYLSFQNFVTFSQKIEIQFLKKLLLYLKFWSIRNVWIDNIVLILFSESKNIIWILRNIKFKNFVLFWIKVINSTICKKRSERSNLWRFISLNKDQSGLIW